MGGTIMRLILPSLLHLLMGVDTATMAILAILLLLLLLPVYQTLTLRVMHMEPRLHMPPSGDMEVTRRGPLMLRLKLSPARGPLMLSQRLMLMLTMVSMVTDWVTMVWATEHTDMDTPMPITVMPTTARGPLRPSPPLLPMLITVTVTVIITVLIIMGTDTTVEKFQKLQRLLLLISSQHQKYEA